MAVGLAEDGAQVAADQPAVRRRQGAAPGKAAQARGDLDRPGVWAPGERPRHEATAEGIVDHARDPAGLAEIQRPRIELARWIGQRHRGGSVVEVGVILLVEAVGADEATAHVDGARRTDAAEGAEGRLDEACTVRSRHRRRSERPVGRRSGAHFIERCR
jgi:hypothetical protein